MEYCREIFKQEFQMGRKLLPGVSLKGGKLTWHDHITIYLKVPPLPPHSSPSCCPNKGEGRKAGQEVTPVLNPPWRRVCLGISCNDSNLGTSALRWHDNARRDDFVSLSCLNHPCRPRGGPLSEFYLRRLPAQRQWRPMLAQYLCAHWGGS